MTGRRNPPDHRGREAVAGLTQRRRDRGLPVDADSGTDEEKLDHAFFMLARWIASPAGTHGDTGDRAIRALRCLKVSRVADRAEALIAAADDPAILERWRAIKVDKDPAEVHLLGLLDKRTRWLRECEDQLRGLGQTPAHHRRP